MAEALTVAPPAALDLSSRGRHNQTESVIRVLLKGCALISVVTTLAIVGILLTEALGFFSSSLVSELRLSDVHLGKDSGKVTKWLVEPGARVSEGQALAELQVGEQALILKAPRSGLLVGPKGTPAGSEHLVAAGRSMQRDTILLRLKWRVPLSEFFFGTRWTPLLKPRHFGVLPLVCGTLLIVLGSSLVALPVGLGTAIYLSEYASQTTRRVVKPFLEILAGIPTVVYGYFALTFITPMLSKVLPSIGVFNALSASIVVGIMILPMVASLCDDALRSVPQRLRLAGYGLGATQFEVSSRVVVPAALSGIFASFVLAMSRAIGETMAVTLAAGATPKMTLNPLESIQTMTAYIVQVCLGDAVADSIEYKTLFAVGALLFFITLAMNLTAHRVLKRFREEYE